MPVSIFETVVPDAIWASERPIWFGGVRIRSRTTVVRLPGNGLWGTGPLDLASGSASLQPLRKGEAPPDVHMHTRPSKMRNESLERMLALPIEQILVAHADPITDRPLQQLAEAWQFATSKKA